MKIHCKRCDSNQPEGYISRSCYYCGKIIPIPPERDTIPNIAAVKEVLDMVEGTKTCEEDTIHGNPIVMADPEAPPKEPQPDPWTGTY